MKKALFLVVLGLLLASGCASDGQKVKNEAHQSQGIALERCPGVLKDDGGDLGAIVSVEEKAKMEAYLCDRYPISAVKKRIYDGSVMFDCVDIQHQPGLKGQGVPVGSGPSNEPGAGPAGQGASKGGDPAMSSSGACPEGSVPVMVITMEMLKKYPTFDAYFKK